MKRFLIIVAALLALGLGLLAIMPLLISPEMVSRHIHDQVRLLTGRDVSLRDAPVVGWRPFMGIEVSNVVLENSGDAEAAPLLQAERLEGKLSLAAALRGRVAIESYRLIRPRISLSVDNEGTENWAFENGQVSEILKEARRLREQTPTGERPDLAGIDPVDIGRITIVDGTVSYSNHRTGRSETLTNIEMTIDWPDTAEAAYVSGTSIWRDEALSFSLRSMRPLLLLAGGSSEVSVSASSRAFELALSGEANMLSDLQLSGQVALRAPSVRRLWSVFGEVASTGPTLANLSIAADLQATPGQLKFSDAEISLDGNTGRGALQIVRQEGRKTVISGTLAYGVLDLSPYGEAIVQESALGHDGFAELELADLDLRLSAERVRLASLEASQFAAAMTVRNDELLFDIGNASVMNGQLVGTATLRRQGASAAGQVSGRLSGFDATQLSAALGSTGIRLAGATDVEFDLSAVGDSPSRILRNASGTMRVAARNGAIEGADLAALRAQAQSESEALQWSGRTPFSLLRIDMALFGHNAWISGARLFAPNLSAIARGQADLRDGGMAIRLGLGPATSLPGRAKGEEEPEPRPDIDTHLVVGGSLANPLPSRDLRPVRD